MKRSFAAVPCLLLALLSAAAIPGAAAPFTSTGTLPGVRLTLVQSGLGGITGITRSNNDFRLYLVEREGRISVLEAGAVLPQPFLDLRGQINLNDEGGLLSMAFHPRYHDNGLFFVAYTNRRGDLVVARYKVSANILVADAASARVLMTVHQPYRNHNGGQIAFGPDGYLYLSLGDGGSAFDPDCAAQKTDSLLGKILRLDVDQNVDKAPYYGIPASNPFRGTGNPPDEVWAIGFRNPWRFSFDRATGDLWIGDVGQNHREEIDFQPASSRGGENYGWKVMEGSACTTNTTFKTCPATTPACGSTAYTAPVLEYEHDPLCAVTGGNVYRGELIPALRGTYFFGDFCTGTIWAATRDGAGFKVQTLADRAPQLAAFGESQTGELYLGTLDGRLYLLTSGQVGAAVDTVGLFDPANSRFQLKAANTAAGAVREVGFGPRNNRWVPLAGDWDGDGRSTPGFWDGATSSFRLKNSLQGGNADVLLKVTPPSARVRPVVGDWNGDGKDTVGLYDVTTGDFHLKDTLTGRGFDRVVALGQPGQDFLPFAADWGGQGFDWVGLYDPVKSEVTALGIVVGGPGGTSIPVSFQFGPPNHGALPIAGDWNGDGKDGFGVYDPTQGLFLLENGPLTGPADVQFRFGTPRAPWVPLAGVW